MVFIDIFISQVNSMWQSTDYLWSKTPYILDIIFFELANRVLHYFEDEPERPILRQGLMHVAEETELPTKYIQE